MNTKEVALIADGGWKIPATCVAVTKDRLGCQRLEVKPLANEFWDHAGNGVLIKAVLVGNEQAALDNPISMTQYDILCVTVRQ